MYLPCRLVYFCSNTLLKFDLEKENKKKNYETEKKLQLNYLINLKAIK